MFNLETALNKRIIDNIQSYYDSVTERRQSRWQGRILEDLSLAEEAGILSYDDWSACVGVIFYMGTDFDMEDRLS